MTCWYCENGNAIIIIIKKIIKFEIISVNCGDYCDDNVNRIISGHIVGNMKK